MYNKQLAQEWIDWVEMPNPNGAREKDVIPYVEHWASKQQGTIVDVGCGQGFFAPILSENLTYIGVEPSTHLLEHAKKLFPKNTFIEGNAYEIPLENESAESCISIWVWSHLEDIKKAAQETYRILKEEGNVLIITASPDTYEERKTFYAEYSVEGNLLTGTFDLGKGRKLSNTTLYLHTKTELLAALSEAGFTITKTVNMTKAEKSDDGLYIAIEARKNI